jgi:hypothetical protein
MLTNTETGRESSRAFVASDIQLDGKHSEQQDAVPIAFWKETAFSFASRRRRCKRGLRKLGSRGGKTRPDYTV